MFFLTSVLNEYDPVNSQTFDFIINLYTVIILFLDLDSRKFESLFTDELSIFW